MATTAATSERIEGRLPVLLAEIDDLPATAAAWASLPAWPAPPSPPHGRTCWPAPSPNSTATAGARHLSARPLISLTPAPSPTRRTGNHELPFLLVGEGAGRQMPGATFQNGRVAFVASHIRPYTPKWNEIRDIIGEELDPVYNGRRTAREAGEAITRRVNPLLAEYKTGG